MQVKLLLKKKKSKHKKNINIVNVKTYNAISCELRFIWKIVNVIATFFYIFLLANIIVTFFIYLFSIVSFCLLYFRHLCMS